MNRLKKEIQALAQWDFCIEALPKPLSLYKDGLGRFKLSSVSAVHRREILAVKTSAQKAFQVRKEAAAAAVLGRASRLLREEDAKKYFKTALKLDADFQFARLWLAETLLEENPRQALLHLRRCGNSFARFLYEGAAFCRLRSWKAARESFQRAQEQSPKNPWPHVFLGIVHRELRDNETALQEYRRAQELGFNAAALFWLQAAAYSASGNSKGLYDAVREAFRRFPGTGFIGDLFDLYAYIADLPPELEDARPELEEMRPSRRTLRQIDSCLDRTPNLAWALAWRADFISRPHFSFYKEAVKDLRRAADLEPKAAWIRAYLSRTLDFTGDLEGAMEALNRAVELDPRCGWILAWRGALLLKRRRPVEALRDLDKALSLDADYPQLHAWRGQALRLNGKFETAVEELELAIRLEPGYLFSYAELCRAYQGLGEWSKAAKLFIEIYGKETKFGSSYLKNPQETRQTLTQLSAAIEKTPQNPHLRAWRAWFLIQQGKAQEALKDLREIKDTKIAFLYFARAQAQKILGSEKEAEKNFNRACALSPNATFLGERGLFFYHKGALNKALSNLARAVNSGGTHAQYLCFLGAAFLEKNNFKEALKHLNRALSLHPRFAEALAHRAQAYRQSGQKALCRKDLEAAISFQKESPWAYWFYSQLASNKREEYAHLRKAKEYSGPLPGRIQKALDLKLRGFLNPEGLSVALRHIERIQKSGDYLNAIQISQEILKKRPRCHKALLLLAEALRCAGRFQDSVEALDRAVRVNPRDYPTRLLRATAYRRIFDFEAALKETDQVLKEAPRFNADARLSRSEALRNLGRFEEAFEEASAILSQNPKEAQAYWLRAKAARQNQDLLQALQDVEAACRLNPKDAKAFAWRGDILRKLGKKIEALACLNETLRLEPSCAWALVLRAEIRRELGSFEDCLLDIQQALHWDPHCSCVFDLLGQECAKVKEDASYAWVYACRGALHRGQKQWSEAARDLNHAVKLDPSCFWAWAWKGELQLAVQNSQEALEDFDKALSIFPSFKDALVWKGRALFERNKHSQALACFQKVLKQDPSHAWASVGASLCLQKLKRTVPA